ncbi:MAG: response regulator [Bacteroidetes bacterium]|nr:response regulator [Bacteroidota bacterium]
MDKTNGRILVIDDDKDILMTAKLVLRQHFKEVVTEYNHNKVKMLIMDSAFDVILMDMNYSTGATSGKEGTCTKVP